ncbi:glycosyltransferase [Mucilaginibacter sp. CAU 1740]|uniref:glycosyltransferase n=1 Tax=Mucilaginibacter sp. CAU 1740 TaxID=3140365 RepID=UPI00325BF4D0
MKNQNDKVILIVNDALHKGGKERRMLELVKGLIANDYKVVLVLLSDIVEYEYVYSLPIELICIKRKRKFELAAFNKLKSIIKQYRPGIIHSWGFVPSVYLGPLAKIYKIKFVNGIIADAIQNLTIRNKFYLMSKISFPFSDRILANSNAGIKAYRPPAGKAQCIYNGIDLKRFEGLKPKEQMIAELLGNDVATNHKIVGMVAAFEDRKDFESVTKAAITVCTKMENAYFILVGGGSNLERIKAMVPATLSNRIVFPGKRQDVESINNIFDIGVLLTNSSVHGEGISNTIIEYMALAKPVIATRGGGTDEIVNDNVNGYRIDAYAPDQLVEKIELLLNNEQLAKTLGNNGRKLIEDKFSLDIMTSAFINVYKELTAAK